MYVLRKSIDFEINYGLRLYPALKILDSVFSIVELSKIEVICTL